MLRMVERAQEVLHLPPDLAPGAPEKQPPVVVSWLPRMLEEVALEQFLPQVRADVHGHDCCKPYCELSIVGVPSIQGSALRNLQPIAKSATTKCSQWSL